MSVALNCRGFFLTTEVQRIHTAPSVLDSRAARKFNTKIIHANNKESKVKVRYGEREIVLKITINN